MTPSSSGPSPVERVLDLALYAPVGMVLAAREVLPRWVEAGRRRVGSQLNVARAVGRLAVGQGSRQTGDVLRRAAHQAEGVLAGLGLVPSSPDPTGEDTHREPAVADAASSSSSTVAAEPSPRAAAPDVVPGPDVGELPIPGYDTLSASQVVQRLPGLSPAELEAVRSYELGGRARKTVLLKVAQLRAGS